MKQVSLIVISFLISTLGDNFARSQNNYPPDETLKTICGKYLDESSIFISDLSLPADPLKAVATDSVVMYYSLYRDYLHVKYPLLGYPKNNFEYWIEHTKNTAVCRFRLEGNDTTTSVLHFSKEGQAWKVSNLNGEHSLTHYYQNLQKAYAEALEVQKERGSIEQVIRQFWEGMNQLYLNGDTTLLYTTATADAYERLRISYKMQVMSTETLGNRHRYDSLIMDQFDVSADSARVHVRVGHLSADNRLQHSGSTTMNLLKQNGAWRVAGEGNAWNDDPERIVERRFEFDQFKRMYDALQAYNQLRLALNDVFIKKDMTALGKIATPSMIHLIGKFMLKVPADYNTAWLVPTVMDKKVPLYSFTMEKFQLTGDTVSYGDGKDLIQFVKFDSVFKLAGFAGVYSGPFTDAFVADHFNHFMSLRGFYYDPYHGSQIEVQSSLDNGDVPEEKQYAHTCFELKWQPQFPGGGDSLYAFIGEHMRYPEYAKKNKLDGAVYVNFIVEKNGTLSNITVTASPHESLSNEAIRLIKLMPAWNPGVSDYTDHPVRAWHTMVVWFEE